jgi:two-component system, oxyanion-binding sensor
MKIILGFMPLLDCASLVVAAERGFAAEEGIEFVLVRETSWANIRDRVVVGHFDAAHMLGPMVIASSLGIGHVRVPLIAPFALGLGGNAITASQSLWEQMANQGASAGSDPDVQASALKRVVETRGHAGLEPLTFGMVYPFSCHNYELRYWLASAGVDPDCDVRLVVIPPPLLVDSMRVGQIDGFCVGEPWNSVAVQAGVGTIVTTTSAIWPLSPEKVLGCRLEWAERHPMQLAALLRALYKASMWCERPENHTDLAKLLAQPRYVGAPADLLHRALSGQLVLTANSQPIQVADFYVPAQHDATFPWVSHALWFYSQMLRWRQVAPSPDHLAAVRSTYRPSLYRAALSSLDFDLPVADTKVERFFDGQTFDPDALKYTPGL